VKSNIAFDIDGVLYNFVDPAYEELVMYHGVTIAQEDFWMKADELFSKRFWDSFYSIEILYSKSKSIKSDVDTINKLSEIYNILYITNRPENCYLVTKNWLKREGFPTPENLFLTDNKVKILKDFKPKFFVEDRPQEDYSKYTQVILRRTPYNLSLWNKYKSINSISELIK
jgi:uncharacterized HAD superfamily protein